MNKFLVVLLCIILTLSGDITETPCPINNRQISLIENELSIKTNSFDSDKFAKEFLATQPSSTYKNITAKYLYENAGDKFFLLQEKIKKYNRHKLRMTEEELEDYSSSFFVELVKKNVFAKKLDRKEKIKENWVASTQFKQFVIRVDEKDGKNPLLRERGKRTQQEKIKSRKSSCNPCTTQQIKILDEDKKETSVDFVDTSSHSVEQEYEDKVLRETFYKVIHSYTAKREEKYKELWKDILSQMLDKIVGVKTLIDTEIAEKHGMKINTYRNEKMKLNKALASSNELRSFL